MSFPGPIPNEALREADVPRRGSDWWPTVVAFANTFNGYEELGGFEQCAEVANHRRECQTLSDFRACLFFEVRRAVHTGNPPEGQRMMYIYDLLDRIRERAGAE